MDVIFHEADHIADGAGEDLHAVGILPEQKSCGFAFADALDLFVGNGGAAGYGHQFFIGKLGLMDFIIKIYGNLLWKV